MHHCYTQILKFGNKFNNQLKMLACSWFSAHFKYNFVFKKMYHVKRILIVQAVDAQCTQAYNFLTFKVSSLALNEIFSIQISLTSLVTWKNYHVFETYRPFTQHLIFSFNYYLLRINVNALTLFGRNPDVSVTKNSLTDVWTMYRQTEAPLFSFRFELGNWLHRSNQISKLIPMLRQSTKLIPSRPPKNFVFFLE